MGGCSRRFWRGGGDGRMCSSPEGGAGEAGGSQCWRSGLGVGPSPGLEVGTGVRPSPGLEVGTGVRPPPHGRPWRESGSRLPQSKALRTSGAELKGGRPDFWGISRLLIRLGGGDGRRFVRGIGLGGWSFPVLEAGNGVRPYRVVPGVGGWEWSQALSLGPRGWGPGLGVRPYRVVPGVGAGNGVRPYRLVPGVGGRDLESGRPLPRTAGRGGKAAAGCRSPRRCALPGQNSRGGQDGSFAGDWVSRSPGRWRNRGLW